METERSIVVLGLILVLPCLILVNADSSVTLTTKPSEIKTGLTRSMTLRCTVNADDAVPTTSGAVVGRDVTDSVRFVTSLVVSRNNGQHVATLTPFGPPTVLVDGSSLTVTGSFPSAGDSNSGELGYIDLTWKSPGEMQAGMYMCEANAITDVGHNVVLSNSTEIIVSYPTMVDLAQYIHALEDKVQTLEKDKAMSENNTAQLLSNMTQSCQCQGGQQTIETGLVRCDSSSWWTGRSGNDLYKVVDQQFSNTYTQPPVVHLGVVKLYTDGKNTTEDLYYYVDVENLDTKGFSVKCKTLQYAHIHPIKSLLVSWISFGQL